MIVTIFGAAGGVGKWAVKHALEKGYEVRAFVRNASKIKVSDDKLTVIQGSITDEKAVYEAIQGVDAVIWCVGIPIKRSYPGMDSYDGHKVLFKAMEKADIKRLIDWGTPTVPFEKDKKSFITVVPGMIASVALTKAKKEMLLIGDMLKQSNFDWTLVRFMAPKDTPYKGNVKVGFGDTKMSFAISREDIGAFMVEQVESKQYVKTMPIIGS